MRPGEYSQPPMPPRGNGDPEPRRLGRLLILAPLLLFLALAGLFFVRLGAGDASRLPSPMIGKVVPNVTLPPLEGVSVGGFSDADLRQGKVTLVNIFASWCVPCRDEHPFLMRISRDRDLASQGVRVFGLNYKDDPANARKFLAEGGNPYALVGVDRSGRASIDWGVYGVPETFVVRGDGTIAYKFIGPISEKALNETLLPEIRKAIR
jgi:cytochrome c biogenesis protein CcmG/thiol:disulfide interchange protein DsbE